MKIIVTGHTRGLGKGIYDLDKRADLTTKFQELMDNKTRDHACMVDFSTELYEQGYSAIDLVNVIQESPKVEESTKACLMLDFQKVMDLISPIPVVEHK